MTTGREGSAPTASPCPDLLARELARIPREALPDLADPLLLVAALRELAAASRDLATWGASWRRCSDHPVKLQPRDVAGWADALADAGARVQAAAVAVVVAIREEQGPTN